MPRQPRDGGCGELRRTRREARCRSGPAPRLPSGGRVGCLRALLPPVVEGRRGDATLVLGRAVARLDRLGDLVRHVVPLQVRVDLEVGEPEVRFVRLTGQVVEQVRGGCLLVEAGRSTEVLEQLPALRLREPVSGVRSTPPSPYFVKKPVTASAAWSVPTTRSPSCPATAYWATIRVRALTLPLTKSLSSTPDAAVSCTTPSTPCSMLTTMPGSAAMNCRASCASSSSACTRYGIRTVTKRTSCPSARRDSVASCTRRPASVESWPPLTART